MPGPMRTQLQAEVSRQFEGASRADEVRPGLLAWLFHWQRAVATVAMALLMIGLFAWNGRWFSPSPASQTKQVVLNETAPATVGRELAAQGAASADGLAKRTDEPAAGRDRDAKEQATAPGVATAAPPTDALAAGRIAAAPKPAVVAPPAATAPAGAPSVAQPRAEEFASKLETSAHLRQNFAQSPAQLQDRARKAPSLDERTSQLLNQFEFRQSGSRVEIVDADGSVYAGEIDLVAKKDALAAKERAKTAVSPPASEAKNKAGSPADAQAADVAATFNFRASGVSNTLRQNVTIEGVYQASAPPVQNAPGESAAGGMATRNAAELGRAQAQQAPSQGRARVVGRAQVNGRSVEVDADATK